MSLITKYRTVEKKMREVHSVLEPQLQSEFESEIVLDLTLVGVV